MYAWRPPHARLDRVLQGWSVSGWIVCLVVGLVDWWIGGLTAGGWGNVCAWLYCRRLCHHVSHTDTPTPLSPFYKVVHLSSRMKATVHPIADINENSCVC